MVTVNSSADGHQYRNYETESPGAVLDASTGTFQDVIYTSYYSSSTKGVLRIGYFGHTGNSLPIYGSSSTLARRYSASVVFESIALDQGDSIGSATFTFYPVGVEQNSQVYVQAFLSPPSSNPSAANLPESQVLTTAKTLYDSSSDSNSDVDTFWTHAESPVVVNIKAVLQEAVNNSSWVSGSRFVVTITPLPWLFVFNQGSMGIEAEESAAIPAQVLDYELTVPPTITSVSTDNTIATNETNVEIAGTNLDGVSAINISKGGVNYPQTIDTISSTLITFNMAGNAPVDTGYTLTLTKDQLTVSQSVDISGTQGTGGGGTDNIVTGEVLTIVDGHEYVDEPTGFPGTWETQATPDNSGFFTGGVMVGEFAGVVFKLSMKFGPFNIDPGSSVSSATLNLNVLNNYKLNDLRIKAVLNPDATDISGSNIISGQSFASTVVSVSNSSWGNVNSVSNWVQTVNPKPIDITALLQEMVDHANFSNGDSIQSLAFLQMILSSLESLTVRL